MDANGARKYGNLRLVPITRTPEEQLQLETQEAWARVRGKNGKVVGRAAYEIAEGVQRPDSVKARRIRELREAGVDRVTAWNTAFGPLHRYFNAIYGIDPANTGEFELDMVA